MSQQLYTLEEVAGRLGLHVRTVRRHVREGRLKALRVGGQYRVARADLEELTGAPAPAGAGGAEAMCVVTFNDIDAERAARLSTLAVSGVIGERLRVEAMHDVEGRRLKLVVIGALGDCRALLAMVEAAAEGMG
jgi:excisionase family DNA binding protein